MGKHKYSSKTENEHTARAVGRDLNISVKHSVMVCNQLRNKNLLKSKELLKRVLDKKQAIPYTRFNFDRGHKKKIGPGRYPVKTVKAILRILDNVESNAQAKGLNSSLLKIIHVNAHKASTPRRHGRKGGVSSKRSHVEIIVEETADEKKQDKNKNKKQSQKETKEDKKNKDIKKPEQKKVKENKKEKEKGKQI
tara:strand:- start:338 stop:919 length:582 start_codon:yes stop_codon:yes gene_type:complete